MDKERGRAMIHEGVINVCAHRVSYWYEWDGRRVKPDVAVLEEAAEERAKECIIDGNVSGELNCLIDDKEVRGWWDIERR
jgi:hypothetical protein